MEKKLTIAQIRSKNKTAHPDVVKEFDRIHGRYFKGYEEKLYEFLQEPTTIKLWGDVLKKDIDNVIDKLIKEQMDRNDFVDFSDADLRKKIRMLLTRIRKESPSVESRIRIQLGLLDHFDDLDSFYGWEKMDNIIEGIAKDFKKIYAEGDEEIRRLLFEICVDYINRFEHLRKEPQEIQSVIWDCYVDDYTQEVLDYINRRIEKISSSQDLSKEEKIYSIGWYIQSTLNIMISKKATEEQLLSYGKKYWENRKVRQWFINYYRREGRLDKAIALLEESIGMDTEYPVLIEDYKSYQAELKELYRKGLK